MGRGILDVFLYGVQGRERPAEWVADPSLRIDMIVTAT